MSVEAIRESRILGGLREKLQSLKLVATNKTALENTYKEGAAEILPLLLELDGKNGDGVRFEWEGKELAAFYCQNKPTLLWDMEKLVPWLKEKGYWNSVKVTTLDPDKLAAEISSGNIPASEAARFQVEKAPSAAYVKFINPKPDSK